MGQQIRFGAFTFDPATGSLSKNGTRLPLQSQPARVLALLAARPGVIVTRDELRREVWRDTWVDFDQGLNFCIRQIRIALDDEARRPTFVQTLPNRGYRFVAAVTPLAAAALALPPERRRSLRARVTRAAVLSAAAVIGGIAIGVQSARLVVAELGPASDIQHLSAHLEPGDFVRGAWRHHIKPLFSSTPVSVGAPGSEFQSQPATPASPQPGS
jgi:DNA-binding winged helix-turn-helix (wHTH) protein